MGGSFKNGLQNGALRSCRALEADGVYVRGDILLGKGFTAEGEVNLVGAKIDGNLACTGGTFRNPPHKGIPHGCKALSADFTSVKGAVFLSEGFTAEGEVRFSRAQIGGDLDCGGGTFKNPLHMGVDGSGTALNGDRVNVRGYVFLNSNFTSEGMVRLLETHPESPPVTALSSFGGPNGRIEE